MFYYHFTTNIDDHTEIFELDSEKELKLTSIDDVEELTMIAVKWCVEECEIDPGEFPAIIRIYEGMQYDYPLSKNFAEATGDYRVTIKTFCQRVAE